MERSSSNRTPVLADLGTAGPRPSDIVTAAWSTAGAAAVCDPPPPPTAPTAATGNRSHADTIAGRSQSFTVGMGRELFKSSSCGILLVTPRGRVTDANPAFLAITGRSWSEVAGNRVAAALGIVSAESLLSPSVMRPGGTPQVERSCRHRSGRALELELTTIPVLDDNGATTALAIHIVDITAPHQAERTDTDAKTDTETKTDTDTDTETKTKTDVFPQSVGQDRLTGLTPRQAVLDSGDSLMPATVAFAKIESFDHLVKIHGKQAIDELLVTLAARVRITAGRSGLAARWSDDELLLVLPGQTVPLEQLRRSLRDHLQTSVNTSAGRISVGIGLGVVRSQGTSISETILRADQRSFLDRRNREALGSAQGRTGLTVA